MGLLFVASVVRISRGKVKPARRLIIILTGHHPAMVSQATKPRERTLCCGKWHRRALILTGHPGYVAATRTGLGLQDHRNHSIRSERYGFAHFEGPE
jgi:hypothetical protein